MIVDNDQQWLMTNDYDGQLLTMIDNDWWNLKIID